LWPGSFYPHEAKAQIFESSNRQINKSTNHLIFESSNQQINKSPNISPQVGFQQFAPGCVFQPFDGFFFDLPDPLARKAEFLANFFERMRVFAV
jgi:hypothetical protein